MKIYCALLLSIAFSASLATFSSDMCSLCVSFLEQTEKHDLLNLQSGISKSSNCEESCNTMVSGESQISCFMLCDHFGSKTFTSLVDASDYVNAKEMCSSHQICSRESGFAGLQLESQMTQQQANATRSKPGNVTVNGDLTVTGALKTKSIRSSALTVNGSITVTHAVRTEFLKADNVKASVIETSTVSSPTGSVTLSGNLAMQNSPSNPGTLAASLLQTDSLVQMGVRQWQMVSHDDFEESHHEWTNPQGSFVEVTNTPSGDKFMGGHCKNTGESVKKTFHGLPDHSFLRLQAKYHFLDSWEGETGYMKVNNKVMWVDTNDVRGAPHGLDVDGSGSPDRKFAAPVDIVIPHTDSSVFIEFGSTLDEHACNEAFGVDDVMLHIR